MWKCGASQKYIYTWARTTHDEMRNSRSQTEREPSYNSGPEKKGKIKCIPLLPCLNHLLLQSVCEVLLLWFICLISPLQLSAAHMKFKRIGDYQQHIFEFHKFSMFFSKLVTLFFSFCSNLIGVAAWICSHNVKLCYSAWMKPEEGTLLPTLNFCSET